MTHGLARLLAVLVVVALAATLTACLGPQLEVRVENESDESVVFELTGGGRTERSDVLPDGGLEFRVPEPDAWTITVNGASVADSTTMPRSLGPILFVHVDRDGEVQVARRAEE